VVVSVSALILTWALALPIGIYSAVRQYSVGDYVATFVGFIGLAVPTSCSAGAALSRLHPVQRPHRGLFSPELQDARGAPRVPGIWPSTCRSRLILGLAGRRSRSGSCARICWTSCASRTW